MSSNSLPSVQKSTRIHLFDFYRSCFMLFVFFHHAFLRWPGQVDSFDEFNPFAELFVGLAGFMVGLVYLYRDNYAPLVKRGIKILAVYYCISLPVSLVSAILGQNIQPIWSTVVKNIFMMEDLTGIGILRFYGLIFLFLPIILRLYKHSKRTLVYISAAMFIVSTYLYQSAWYATENSFITGTVFTLIQWQLFFILGLCLGDMYHNRSLSVRHIAICSFILIVLGILLDYSVHDIMSYVKFPYSFEKYINLLYSAPVTLYLFYYLFKFSSGGLVDRAVRVVGRNSLYAFAASEITVQVIHIYLFCTKPYKLGDSLLPTSSGIVSMIMIIVISWGYEKRVKSESIIQLSSQ